MTKADPNQDKQDKTGSNACRHADLKSGNLIVITGPSGVGKGTVVRAIIDRVPDVLRSVSVTTRQKRKLEVEGIDYFFKSPEEFLALKDRDELMEWAEFAGNLYGTPRAWVETQMGNGKDVLLEIEVQGALQILKQFPGAVMIFLKPPSFESLKERLVNRATESPDKIALRLKKGGQEMQLAESGAYFTHHVINDNLEKAIEDLVQIILVERQKTRGSK